MPEDTPKPASKPDSKDEYRRQIQQKLQNEWKDMEVKVPMGDFAPVVIYQAVVPYIPVVFMVFAYIWAWTKIPELSWLMVAFMPAVFFGGIYLYIVSLIWFTQLVTDHYDKVSPPVEGVFDRKFKGKDAADPRISYYHKRGFIYKLPVFFAKKSIFPWTVNRALIKLGHNKIHPDAMYMDSFNALEFTDLGPGYVGGDGIVMSSHVVDSIFGRLTINAVKCEQNAVIHTNAVMAPGSHLSENVSLMSNSFSIKGQKFEPGAVLFLIPAKQTEYKGTFADAEKYLKSGTRNVIH